MFSLPRVNLALEFCSQSSEFFRCLLFNRLACLAQNLLEANVRLAGLQHAEQGFNKPFLCGCNASAFANRFEGQRGSNRFTAESTGVQLPSCFQCLPVCRSGQIGAASQAQHHCHCELCSSVSRIQQFDFSARSWRN